jgi:hypothetical protein
MHPFLSLAWQVAYTVVAISCLFGLAAMISIGALVCVRTAIDAFRDSTPGDR